MSTLNMVATSASAQALPMLIEIAKNSPNVKARKDAIFWMSQSRGDKDSVVDSLLGLSSNSDDADAVIFALSQIRTGKSFNALATIAQDKNKTDAVRQSALFWISQSRSSQAAATLGNVASSDPDMEMRKQAVFWLEHMKTPEATQALENLLRRK